MDRFGRRRRLFIDHNKEYVAWLVGTGLPGFRAASDVFNSPPEEHGRPVAMSEARTTIPSRFWMERANIEVNSLGTLGTAAGSQENPFVLTQHTIGVASV